MLDKRVKQGQNASTEYLVERESPHWMIIHFQLKEEKDKSFDVNIEIQTNELKSSDKCPTIRMNLRCGEIDPFEHLTLKKGSKGQPNTILIENHVIKVDMVGKIWKGFEIRNPLPRRAEVNPNSSS